MLFPLARITPAIRAKLSAAEQENKRQWTQRKYESQERKWNVRGPLAAWQRARG
jgi:hypothetical protein